MGMSTHIEFKWTADLLAEFIRDYSDKVGKSAELMEQFKKSKQPKPEWEIIGYAYPSGTTDQLDTSIIGPLSYNWNNAVIRDYPIHSVKRFPDNSIWSIGDKFRATAGCDLTIKRFEIVGKGIHVWSVEFGYWPLHAIKQIPLFTTEDGVDVHEGASVALLSTDKWIVTFPVKAPASPFKGDRDQFKYFSTKEAATEYVTYNKPCISLTDVLNVYESDSFMHSINAMASNRTKE